MKGLPSTQRQIFNVWYRNFLQFRRSWSVSFFWIIFEPAIVLGAIGFGVGSYINNVNGVAYIDYFFPALLCTTAMMVSFFESTYGNFSKLTYQQIYVTMIMAPIEVVEVTAGEILWSATKGLISSVGVALVAFPLGIFESWRILPVFGVVFVTAILFSCFGMIITTMVKNYDSIVYPTSGLIVPMSLLSGTYFPVDQFPFFIKYLVMLSPLTHSVALSRSLLLGTYNWTELYHLFILIFVSILLFRVAVVRLNKILIQ